MSTVLDAEGWVVTVVNAIKTEEVKIVGGFLMDVAEKVALLSEDIKWFIRSILSIAIIVIVTFTLPRDTTYRCLSRWHRLCVTNTTTVGEFLLPD